MNTTRLSFKKANSPAAMLAASAIACFGISQQAGAAVVWLASDNGTDLTLATDGGSFATGPLSSFSAANAGTRSDWSSDSLLVGTRVGPHFFLNNVGMVSGNNPWIATSRVGSASGDNFGFSGTNLFVTLGVTNPNSTMTFSGLTIATAFGTNLDAGPVLLWTNTTTGDTISVARATAIPEPSSSLLAGLGAFALLARRRRLL